MPMKGWKDISIREPLRKAVEKQVKEKNKKLDPWLRRETVSHYIENAIIERLTLDGQEGFKKMLLTAAMIQKDKSSTK